jgi:N-carbamoyl-L-amino-acid hydrolase
MTNDLRVNSERMLESFDQLASVGATAEGGVHRPALSEAHLAARKWFREEVECAGLEFHVDGAGNHSALLASGGRVAQPKAGGAYRDQTLLIGSHLDSVPNGGRFDGALGVIAALEVLRTIKDNGFNSR